MESRILSQWNRWHPDTPPVGFLLREAYPHRWLRIHSLPDGKRYPTSGFDYAELVRRHTAVADDVLGSDGERATLFVDTCKGRTASKFARIVSLTGGDFPRLWQLPADLWGEDVGFFSEPMCIFGGLRDWQRPHFERLIVQVAEDRCRGVVVNLDSGQVYAPYDGGADLIYSTERARDRARERFTAWRSQRDDGL